MADETPQKRVLPARERRESAAKRRASSPPPPPPTSVTPKKSLTQASSSEPRVKRKYVKRASLIRQTTPSNAASTPPVTEEFLPTRLASSRPLPTSLQKQAANLSDKEYQSIAESAILAASLHRSRMQWLCDGIFEKYWTKPVKKKGVTDVPPNNPDQKSMHKLGNATITIEPHAFEVSFFTVRDPLAPLPYYRHPNQHTPKPAIPPTPQYGIYYPPPPPPTMPTQTPPAQAAVSVVIPPPSQTLTPVVKQENKISSSPYGFPSSPASVSAPVGTRQDTKTQSPGTTRSTPAAAGPKATTDPVIQMLAARAASDPRLKELMKVVATSKASPEQLKEFQSHIDEFNAVVRRQEAERATREKEGLTKSTSTPPVSTPSTSTSIKAPPKPASSVASSSPSAAHPAVYNTGAVRGPASASLPPPGPYMGYAPPPRPEPIIKHIVVEFNTNASSSQSASPDRWLFPEFAVLDIRYGGLEMLCSFFVERKGSDILAALGSSSAEEMVALQGKWKAEEEYYQPVTMTVKAVQHRTIESIARAAKSLAQVQEHMKEVMKNKTRAPEEYLVHQLPRTTGLSGGEVASMDFVDSAVELGSDEEDDELREWYDS